MRASRKALRWMSGSPPVISTSFVPMSCTFAMRSASGIFSPPKNEYSVSHHTHRSGQPVSRMNVQGYPAHVLSPWIEWKTSVTRKYSFMTSRRQDVPQGRLPHNRFHDEEHVGRPLRHATHQVRIPSLAEGYVHPHVVAFLDQHLLQIAAHAVQHLELEARNVDLPFLRKSARGLYPGRGGRGK